MLKGYVPSKSSERNESEFRQLEGWEVRVKVEAQLHENPREPALYSCATGDDRPFQKRYENQGWVLSPVEQMWTS